LGRRTAPRRALAERTSSTYFMLASPVWHRLASTSPLSWRSSQCARSTSVAERAPVVDRVVLVQPEVQERRARGGTSGDQAHAERSERERYRAHGAMELARAHDNLALLDNVLPIIAKVV
jgi:hypothetical protein